MTVSAEQAARHRAVLDIQESALRSVPVLAAGDIAEIRAVTQRLLAGHDELAALLSAAAPGREDLVINAVLAALGTVLDG